VGTFLRVRRRPGRSLANRWRAKAEKQVPCMGGRKRKDEGGGTKAEGRRRRDEGGGNSAARGGAKAEEQVPRVEGEGGEARAKRRERRGEGEEAKAEGRRRRDEAGADGRCRGLAGPCLPDVLAGVPAGGDNQV
jgi:hypothetical protein